MNRTKEERERWLCANPGTPLALGRVERRQPVPDEFMIRLGFYADGTPRKEAQNATRTNA